MAPAQAVRAQQKEKQAETRNAKALMETMKGWPKGPERTSRMRRIQNQAPVPAQHGGLPFFDYL